MNGQPDRAMADWARALALNPRNAHALYGTGLAKRTAGNATGGEADIAAAIALRPGVAGEMARLGLK